MLKNIYNKILLLFFPLIIINKILSNVLTVKFGNITPFRIGHLVGELSIWLLESKKKDNNKKTLEIWYVPKKVCSKFFFKKIKEKIFITNNFFIKIMYDLCKKYQKKEFLIKGATHGERDIECLISQNNKIVEFTPDEIYLGNEMLKEIGIKENQEIVSLCVRDKFYLNNIMPKINWSYLDYKNSDINSYNKSVKFLNDRNISVIRMGAGAEKKWEFNSNVNYDYANSKHRSSFLDFFLVYRSKFVITSGTGFYWVPYVLKKPIIMCDFVPVGDMCTYVTNSIQIFKHIYSNEKKRTLNLKELFSKKYNVIHASGDYVKNNLKVIDNSPDEISDCVNEMYFKIENKWIETIEQKKLQENFWQNYPKQANIKENSLKKRHGILSAKIGSEFLKKYY